MSLMLILIAAASAAAGGLPGLCAARRSAWGERVFVILIVCGSILGAAGAVLGLHSSVVESQPLPLPRQGWRAALQLDALSAFFLLPVFMIGGLGAIYGLEYWRQAEHAFTGRKLRCFWGLLIAGMAMLILARNALVFLLGWETMALSAFMLISTEDRRGEVRGASWIYLIATHFGTLCLFAMFALMRMAAGSFELKPIGVEQAGLGLLTAIFFLALAGFGLKAGLMPLHYWLPAAHANAPSHVSAILSGVMIKMGIYGLARIASLLPEPPLIWGALLLLLGALSGVLGVLFALGQHDLKRLLAYHSVENIGIIIMGLGLALAGRSAGRNDWIALGMAGCLLHVWNHGLFKSLLFLSAGAVARAAGTREIERLGGLGKMMPRTSALFLIGAVAICGLPPLNGFISELFIYLGLFRSAGSNSGSLGLLAALAVPALALIGALAIACFVKAYGAVFLGEYRGSALLAAREAGAAMILPMALLAACCFFIGLFPLAVAPALERAVGVWAGWTDGLGPPVTDAALTELAPLRAIGALSCALCVLIVISAMPLRNIFRLRELKDIPTWDCGYARPTARMQYTGSSFAQLLVGMYRWVLRPRVHRPEISGIFNSAARFESHVDDIVLEGQLLPFARAARRLFDRIRSLQQGVTQQYVLSILIAVLALLAWTLPIEQLLSRLFAR